MKYATNISEQQLKNEVAQDFFSKFDHTATIGNIDFAVKPKNPAPNLWGEICFLWAEAKRAKSNVEEMLTQLVLTIGNERKKQSFKYPPPNFLGCFDREHIAFVPYNELLPIFNINDFNWKVTPNDHTSKEFKIVLNKIKALMKGKDIYIFNFDKDEKELKQFIQDNFIVLKNEASKLQINKNNFTWVYQRWLEEVKPSIDVDWNEAKKIGVIDGYFYLADLLSEGNKTLLQKLYVLLKINYYELGRKFAGAGFWNSNTAGFKDGQKRHSRFWAKYERPPKKEFWEYIIARQDLLVPQDIRERKGSFYTPKIWVERSQQYIADVLGEDWQDEYYVWDCAAGTGNLLAGLTNKRNLWASTLDQADVDVMKTIGLLYENQVFQFDFLNDPFTPKSKGGKIPDELFKIINDENTRQKLIIYINPPMAEHGNRATFAGDGQHKPQVSTTTAVYNTFQTVVGTATRELFVQFFLRIYTELSNVKLASFSTMKLINAQNFIKFRNYFQAKYLKGFICRANTFDNVKGKFPIGFTIWDTMKKKPFSKIITDIIYNDIALEHCWKEGKKTFYAMNEKVFISDWLRQFYDKQNEKLGFLILPGVDMQQQNGVYVTSQPTKSDILQHKTASITKSNLIEMCIYLAVRHCIEATWMNNRDQFLYPSDGWATDLDFQSDCLTYTLFSGQNNISSKLGVNHWIPFAEDEINARKSFDSHFMLSFISGKVIQNGYSNLFEQNEDKWCIKRKFSTEAKAVFAAGRKLWTYYHEQPSSKVNASLYDIREHFQGRDENGKMNKKSEDETYNELNRKLREKRDILAKKIEPKVYEYGFLKE